jgi:hypothetical protein
MMKNETLKEATIFFSRRYTYGHAKFIKKCGDLNWCKSFIIIEVEKLAKLLQCDYNFNRTFD